MSYGRVRSDNRHGLLLQLGHGLIGNRCRRTCSAAEQTGIVFGESALGRGDIESDRQRDDHENQPGYD